MSSQPLPAARGKAVCDADNIARLEKHCAVLSDLRAEGVFPRFDGERLDSAESMICVGNARIGARLGREP